MITFDSDKEDHLIIDSVTGVLSRILEPSIQDDQRTENPLLLAAVPLVVVDELIIFEPADGDAGSREFAHENDVVRHEELLLGFSLSFSKNSYR